MFRFILFRLDGTVMDFAMGAANLPAAFEPIARDWWRPEMVRSFGVWQHHSRIARARCLDSVRLHHVVILLPHPPLPADVRAGQKLF